jgi:hypothetical protein
LGLRGERLVKGHQPHSRCDGESSEISIGPLLGWAALLLVLRLAAEASRAQAPYEVHAHAYRISFARLLD